jgi:hypothetical protein
VAGPLAASVVPALIGLAGVALGAGVNMFGQWLFARRKESADARSVARLVSADLLRAQTVLEDWLDDPMEVVSSWASDLEMPAWERGQGLLGSRLDGPDWQTVLLACNRVDGLRRRLATRRPLASDLDEVRAAGGNADTARAVLERHFER